MDRRLQGPRRGNRARPERLGRVMLAARVPGSATPRRDVLLPHMRVYDTVFADTGPVTWTPYTVFFHPTDHVSGVVNTDGLGFRLGTDRDGGTVSVSRCDSDVPVTLVAGSSTTFGIGASSDEHTLASLLSVRRRLGQTCINLGGRSFNAIQEYLLAALHQHRLPPVNRIVLLSGFNNLGLARQPVEDLGDHGTFFLRQRYEALHRRSGVGTRLRRAVARSRSAPSAPMPVERQIAQASEQVIRALDLWCALARHVGAELTYVLQPLAPWVRQPCREEAEIFAELDEAGGFGEIYGDVLAPEVHREYASRLRDASTGLGLSFLDGVDLLAPRLDSQDWAYVDRVHLTDLGHARLADALADAL